MRILTFLIFCAFTAQVVANEQLAQWSFDQNQLPTVTYKGDYPFAPLVTDEQIGIEHRGQREDPYFLLGNYRMVLFTHVSGEYQLMTSERSWGRLNKGDEKNTGVSGAFLTLNGQRINITGEGSIAGNKNQYQMHSGVGYSQYEIALLPQLTLTRTIKVAPSTKPDNGLSAFIIEIDITNNTQQTHDIDYHEFVRANYEMNYQQRSKKLVDYTSKVTQFTKGLIKADFNANSSQPLLWQNKQKNAIYDGYPPSLFLKADKGQVSHQLVGKHQQLNANEKVSVKAGENLTLQFVVGFSFDDSELAIEKMASDLLTMNNKLGKDNNFAKHWLSVLPDFADEKDTDLRRELIWNAHVLEAMSAYSQYFGETKTPQGSNYDYFWGQHASIRDHLQHMLPTLYYNPNLAKSALRYSLQKVTPNGGIPIVEKGYGYQTNLFYEQSDNQLFMFNALNEYFRVTQDYDFLNEQVSYYPIESGAKGSVLDHIEQMFIFMRDEVATGPRGLVRLLNSDWNDDLFFVLSEQPYNQMYMSSESLLNTTMLVKVYGELINHLNVAKSKNSEPKLSASIEQLLAGFSYQRDTIFKHLMKDWGDKDFIRRFYWGNKSVGHDKAYIWPQAFALQIPEISKERKKQLIDVIDKRLFSSEKVGAKLMETTLPTKNKHYAPKGMGENGAMWYSPYGQYVLGVAEVDIDKAWQYFNKVSFKHNAKQYPKLWIGQWTSGDSVNSSLSDFPGNARHMMYNAHPHAYQLYMYYRLKEIQQTQKSKD